jgi:hypothetical protein
VAQGAAAVTLVWTFEFFGPVRAQFLTSAGGIAAGTEVITTLAAHGFTDEDPVVYRAEAGDETVGLVDGVTYYVNAIAASTLSLHTSAADAASDTDRIDLSVSGAERHSLYYVARLYPAGTLLDTGELVVAMTDAGVITVDAPATPTIEISVDISDPTIPGGGQPANGLHTLAVFIDPPGNRGGLFLDGDQIGQDTGALTEWADAVATWEFMDSVANADAFGNLRIFPGFVPPTFVG